MDQAQNHIDLVQLLRIFIKHKKTILAYTLIGLLLGVGAYLYRASRVTQSYQADAIVHVGTLGKEDPIEDIDDLIWKINAGFYHKNISLKAYMVPNTATITNTSYHTPTTRLVEIMANGSSENAVKDEVTQAVNHLLVDHDLALQTYKKDTAEQIAVAQAVQNRGQQTGDIQLAIFTWQENLKRATPSVVIKHPEVTTSTSKQPNKALIVGGGTLLGLFVGIMVVCIQTWWRKNRQQILA